MASDLDKQMMRVAIEEAKKAAVYGDVPVGAVVARADEVLGRAGNARERKQDPTAHAEIIALRAAANVVDSWHLDGCTMCAGALVLGRVERLVFGSDDPKAGFAGSLGDLVRDRRLNHALEVESGVLSGECGDLLKDFFRERR